MAFAFLRIASSFSLACGKGSENHHFDKPADNVVISDGPSTTQLSPAKLSRVQEKKQTREAQEGKLHVKRQEMDKAKVCVNPPLPAFFFRTDTFLDNGCSQTILVSTWSNGTRQAFRGYQGAYDGVLGDLSFVLIFCEQRAHDPEYAAMLDAQPKPRGRGRKTAVYVSFWPIGRLTCGTVTKPCVTTNLRRRRMKSC